MDSQLSCRLGDLIGKGNDRAADELAVGFARRKFAYRAVVSVDGDDFFVGRIEASRILIYDLFYISP